MSEAHAFDYAKNARKTGMHPLSGNTLEFEAGWSQEAIDEGLIRMKDSKTGEKYLFKATDLISNLMVLSGEKESRYLMDGLMAKSKKKSVIEYNFFTRTHRMYMAGEMLRCTIQIVVPDELRELKEVERKHIIHDKGSGIVSAPKTAGMLPKGTPSLGNLKL